jgi:hypothetical protein
MPASESERGEGLMSGKKPTRKANSKRKAYAPNANPLVNAQLVLYLVSKEVNAELVNLTLKPINATKKKRRRPGVGSKRLPG